MKKKTATPRPAPVEKEEEEELYTTQPGDANYPDFDAEEDEYDRTTIRFLRGQVHIKSESLGGRTRTKSTFLSPEKALMLAERMQFYFSAAEKQKRQIAALQEQLRNATSSLNLIAEETS